MLVEVFKTNVGDTDQAKIVVDRIHASFADYTANFDLDDCDRILRVVSERSIAVPALIVLLKEFDIDAEVLSDDIPEVLHL